MKESQFLEIISKTEKLSWSSIEFLAFVRGRIRDITRDKGYTSTHSKKARLFLSDRAFHTVKDGAYMTYRVTNFLKEPKFNAAGLRLLEVKTSGGIMYMQPASVEMRRKGEVGHICFTSHVFDRFGDRMRGERNRKACIKELMSDILGGGFSSDKEMMRRADENGEGPITMYTKSGMLLGEYRSDGDQQLFFYKTFVSLDAVRPVQESARLAELRRIADKVNNMEELSFAESGFLRNYIDDEINKHKQNEQAIGD